MDETLFKVSTDNELGKMLSENALEDSRTFSLDKAVYECMKNVEELLERGSNSE
ncbi:MAG: hypothetical protein ABSD92_14670 [Candidatus Bathyarchaeia archaeon]